MKKQIAQSGYLMALLATIVWSGNFIVARGLNEVYTPISISFFRWLIATIVVFPFAIPYLKRDYLLLLTQWRLMVGLSFLGVTLFNTLIYLAAHFTSALNLSLFAITAPLYVVVLNRIIFKEQLSIRQIIGFLILIAGLLVLLSKGNPLTFLQLKFNKGDLLMAAAASIFGTYSVLVKLKNPAIGNLSFVSTTFILGELMLLPIFIGEQIWLSTEISFYPKNIIQLLYIGIGPSILSFYLWNKSIVGIGSTKAATIYNMLPIFSAFFGIFILHEPVLLAQLISAIIIVIGVLLVIRSSTR
ncbi:MAG TPA: DMT family transporter [Cyclobacteriaceae bacterium]